MIRFITLGLLLCPVLNVRAQWTEVYHDPNMIFNQVVFTDELHGYVMGDRIFGSSAFVLKTADGGLTWEAVNFVTPFLSHLYMIDNNKGYLFRSGSPNGISYTTDAFETYSAPVPGLDSSLNYLDVEMTNDSTGYQLLEDGRLHKITNYGTAVTPVWDSAYFYNFLEFPTSLTGYTGGAGHMSRTTDGGLTWNVLPAAMPYFTLDGKFVSATSGYFIVQDSVWLHSLYKTSDGGNTFTQVSIFNVQHFSAMNNYCLIHDEYGNVSMSHDGGLNWMNETTGMSGNIFRSTITASGTAWMISDAGYIAKRNGLLSMGETMEQNIADVYPNPAQAQVTVKIKTPGGEFILYNSVGKCMAAAPFEGAEYTLSLLSFPAGIYFLQVNDGTGTSTTKLVKQ